MVQQQAYEVVIEHIEALIEAKTLAVGDTLAGERSLAEQFNVSRTSVREAIRVLSVFGIVDSAPGSGPSSGSRIVSHLEAPFASAVRLHLAADSFEIEHLLDARTTLEVGAYRGVTQPRVSEMGDIDALIAQMKNEPRKEDYLMMDAQLHVSLVRLADNPLLTAMMAACAASVAAYTGRAARSIGDWEAAAAVLNSEHQAIAHALARGDGAAAAALVEQHISDYARLGGLIR